MSGVSHGGLWLTTAAPVKKKKKCFLSLHLLLPLLLLRLAGFLRITYPNDAALDTGCYHVADIKTSVDSRLIMWEQCSLEAGTEG